MSLYACTHYISRRLSTHVMGTHVQFHMISFTQVHMMCTLILVHVMCSKQGLKLMQYPTPGKRILCSLTAIACVALFFLLQYTCTKFSTVLKQSNKYNIFHIQSLVRYLRVKLSKLFANYSFNTKNYVAWITS